MIHIKPHHFIDIITHSGAGTLTFEPHQYGHAVHSVAKRIIADKNILLKMELGADDICKPCIHNINGLCDDTIDTSYRPEAPPLKHEWNLLIDNRWCERLGIKQGDTIIAREFCMLIKDKAGDITDIYREISHERTQKRLEKLKKGIAKFLE